MLNALWRMRPFAARSFRTRLQGVSGFTGVGAFRYAVSPAGSTNYEIELTGVAGVKAELFAHGEFVATLACKDGKAAVAFDSRLGDSAIRLKAGDLVEIRQNGCVVLSGALK